MRNIIIFVALLGAAAIFTVLYCLIAAGSQAEKKLTEIMRKEEERNLLNPIFFSTYQTIIVY